jgi:pyruvate,water dikinase
VFEIIGRLFGRRRTADLKEFRELFERFQQILKGNNLVFELISELEDKLSGEYIFDINYLKHINHRLSEAVYLIASNLNIISNNRYKELFTRQISIQEELDGIIEGHPLLPKNKYVIEYDDIDSDMAELAGGKNANLGEIRNRLRISTPDGFVLSTAAYERFMEENELWPQIREIYEQYKGDDKPSIKNYNSRIDLLFEDATVPPDLAKAITKRLDSLSRQSKGDLKLAVRSSAFGEDAGERSFAGQFKSFLSRQSEDVFRDYAGIIASRFKYSVVAYGGEHVLEETELPMAVGVQEMIPARTSGVAYSLEPSGEFTDCLAISACLGLGVGAVEGLADTDYYRISRVDPAQILWRRIGRKKTLIASSATRGIESVPVPEDQQEKACLTEEQIIELARQILMLERYFKRPVDVEWCFDDSGKLFIIQCRPLRISPVQDRQRRERPKTSVNAPVLMHKQGLIAQRGIAAGRVKHVHDDDEEHEFPVGAIAVAGNTTPRLTAIIRSAAAIITDIGSPSGHMATVAREFGVPMIVSTANATELLAEGAEVTVDAEENIVYRGIVEELLEYEAEGEDVYRDLKEYKILRHLLRKIWPLSLIDPDSPDFTARNCRTYHDIVRFCHEKAMRILIDLNISSHRFRGIESRRLKLEIPLGLHVIDLGGGLAPDIGDQVIDSIDKIKSLPMLSMLQGMVAPGSWEVNPVQLGFGDLVSSLTRYLMTDRVSEYQGQNLAVISDHYANISLRLGYHFNVIDTYVSENIDDNYIYFRFVGGVTDTERRHLRATLIKRILEKFNFVVTLSGDLVVARLKKWSQDEVLKVLYEIGRLIGFTRQLDTQMQDEQSISTWFQAFFDHKCSQ